MPTRPRGLLEPCAATSGTHGSEGAPAQQCAGATRQRPALGPRREPTLPSPWARTASTPRPNERHSHHRTHVPRTGSGSPGGLILSSGPESNACGVSSQRRREWWDRHRPGADHDKRCFRGSAWRTPDDGRATRAPIPGSRKSCTCGTCWCDSYRRCTVPSARAGGGKRNAKPLLARACLHDTRRTPLCLDCRI